MPEVGTVCRLEKTAEQFTERLDRMLSTPDISLITSQGTPRPPWPKMLSGLWLLPSAVYLSMDLFPSLSCLSSSSPPCSCYTSETEKQY
ncbi:hypothetical protein RRG08_030638 [Elysia crispata]|uniref:Uncharacterized protein n=1 Tax=Elysia crispata TaxID=231223 RepID=A0AAE0XXL5_9GAST|nr:hypothetical protein RRG08_030638 [Elysia crispata]